MFKSTRALFVIPAAWLMALLLTAGCAGTGAEVKKEGAAPAVGAALQVRDIRTAEKDGGLVITVEGSQPLKYSIFKLDNPLRLAMDLPGAGLGKFTKNIPVNKGAVSFIKPVSSEASKEKGPMSRLEIFLASPAVYDVKGEGNALKIVIAGKAAEAPIAKESAIASSPVVAAAPKETQAVAAPAPMATVAALTASNPAPASPPPPAVDTTVVTSSAAVSGPAATRVANLEVVSSPQGSQVIVQGDGRLDYEYFLVESKSLVLDIYSVSNGIAPLSRKVTDEYIKQIRIGEHFEPRKKVRIVVDLVKPADYKLVSMGDKILLNFGALAQEPDDRLRTSLSNLVTDIYFRPLDDRSVIEIVTAKAPEYQKVDSEDPHRLIIEVINSRVAPEAQKTLDLLTLNREVSKIVSFQYRKADQPMARVVAQFRDSVPYRIEAQGNRILVDIPRAKASGTVAATEPAASSAPVSVAASAAPATTAAKEMAATSVSAYGASTELAEIPVARQYTGRKLSLDFKDADIQDVLRLIADVSGINFVSNTDVTGRITIKMNDVPWDQALDVILKTNKPELAQIREAENIIRITTKGAIRVEEDEQLATEKRKLELQKTMVQAQKEIESRKEQIETKAYKLSYAKAKDVLDRLGDKWNNVRISSDNRTNTIFITGPRSEVTEFDPYVREFISKLDETTPSVQIEARIISVNSTFTKQLGIQWGFNYTADNAHGNAYQYRFPNSATLGGTAGTATENYLVNLPAAGATSGIGLTLGHIADIFTLDLRISAMESQGQVEVLSSPKIFVVQNEKAIINVGSQLPVPKTDAEGNRTVEWKDVGIKLEVTPQVTADKRVFLDVQVERSSKGDDVETTEGKQFSIDTQRAQTKVLLSDGETSVIGGMFQQQKSNTKSGVPGLSRLPIIGFLFRSQSQDDFKKELLIFLTPKIVQPQ